jgi:hypothetical protein
MDDQDRALLELIYDQYRTSLLNVKYYGHELTKLKQRNLFAEIVIAIGATGSTVAGWATLQEKIGVPLWGVVAGTATILATIKPIIRLGEQIEKFARLHSEHNGNYIALKRLCSEIKQFKKVTPEMRTRYAEISKKHDELARDDPPRPSRRLIERFQQEVITEIPVETLWMPKGSP